MGTVTPYETVSGRRYRVRFRQPNKSRTDKRGFKTKREAELYLASIELTKSRGEYISAAKSRVLVGQIAHEWVSSQVQLKPSTRVGYEAIVRTQIDPHWGVVPLGELSYAAVQSWISDESMRVSATTGLWQDGHGDQQVQCGSSLKTQGEVTGPHTPEVS